MSASATECGHELLLPGLNVLVVEDDADTRANLRDILELDSHNVELTGTLQEALTNINLADFSCILLDRRLPDGSADDAISQLRKLAPNAAIIVVTEYADIDGTIAALRHGASDFIVKPINPELIRFSLDRINRIQAAEKRAQQAERLAAIGQVVTSLAHESRNFLQHICNSIEFLEEIDQDNPEALKERLRIHAAEKGLERLLEEVREFAAPMKLDKERKSLQSVWQRAWSEVKETKKPGNVCIYETVADIDLTCNIDSFRMGQVFRNLFENSVAACGDGPSIQVQCESKDGTFWISIRDDGPGLNAEQQENVFQPFFTTKTKGTGLGMAIVKRIVESHGGAIHVGYDYADGAEFIIRLPMSAEVPFRA